VRGAVYTRKTLARLKARPRHERDSPARLFSAGQWQVALPPQRPSTGYSPASAGQDQSRNICAPIVPLKGILALGVRGLISLSYCDCLVFVVPVERIELPTFGLQNRLPVNRLSSETLAVSRFGKIC
jgi:hypothetical protein